MTIVCAILSGCARKHHRTAAAPNAPQPPYSSARGRITAPPSVAIGYSEEGIASWYGIPYNGRQAADGEIYDMETLVAAHRTMPFNTWLKITNLANEKTVNVRVIDRGPFVEGRMIDLSKAAAREIDLLGPGIGRVRLEVVAAPADVPTNDFYAVQVGAFSVAAHAEQVRTQFADRFGTAQIVLKEGRIPLWRVLVGKEASITAAQQLAGVLSGENKDVFIVRLDQTVLNPAPLPPPAPILASPQVEPAPQ
ncbi:MAG: septal ring lytic transglycosylase RlpA family protein [Acidobacteriota bacterium]|nr:septal ring lytic transglycosylase RlpA family protein [Acidobacteriota bacterium]